LPNLQNKTMFTYFVRLTLSILLKSKKFILFCCVQRATFLFFIALFALRNKQLKKPNA